MRLLETLTTKITQAKGLDPAMEAVDGAASSTLGKQPLRRVLSGDWLGHPVHPLMVTLPIGTWTLVPILDTTRREEAAVVSRWLIGLGLLATVPTAAAGVSDWQTNTQNDAERRVGLVHAVSNATASSLYAASWIARRSKHTDAGKLLALAGTAAMTVGGYLGGHLTYRMGVGVGEPKPESDHIARFPRSADTE